MALSLRVPEFELIRDEKKCIGCEVCVRQCSNEVHTWDEANEQVLTDPMACVACQR